MINLTQNLTLSTLQELNCWCRVHAIIEYDALHDLVPVAQFKKRIKHTWRSATFSKAAGFSLEVTVHSWVFLTFSKLYQWYQIAQSVSNVSFKSDIRSKIRLCILCAMLLSIMCNIFAV